MAEQIKPDQIVKFISQKFQHQNSIHEWWDCEVILKDGRQVKGVLLQVKDRIGDQDVFTITGSAALPR